MTEEKAKTLNEKFEEIFDEFMAGPVWGVCSLIVLASILAITLYPYYK